MPDNIVIRSEDEAWTVLENALNGALDQGVRVSFEGWPVFKLTLEGKEFSGALPTRIMPPILALQKEIHRTYCQAHYGTDNVHKLSPKEKEMLELRVELKPGSTNVITDMGDALSKVIQGAHMTGPEAIILVLGSVAMVATVVGWKMWLTHRERVHDQNTTVAMSAEETRRLEIVTRAMNDRPELQQKQQAISEVQNSLSRQLKPDDQIKIEGFEIIDGSRAAEIVPKPKEKSKPVRIDGEFIINEVKFPRTLDEQYRFAVTRVSDHLTLNVTADHEKLTMNQISILKEGGFGLRKVIMAINAAELRGQINKAELYSIDWPDQSQEN